MRGGCLSVDGDGSEDDKKDVAMATTIAEVTATLQFKAKGWTSNVFMIYFINNKSP